MVKCRYCYNSATHRMSCTLDIVGVPLCDSSACKAEFYLWWYAIVWGEPLEKRPKYKIKPVD